MFFVTLILKMLFFWMAIVYTFSNVANVFTRRNVNWDKIGLMGIGWTGLAFFYGWLP